MKFTHTLSISNILTDVCLIKLSVKLKNAFSDIVYNVLVVKRVLMEHGEVCLEINGKQSVKLQSSLIKFKKHFR